MQTFLHKIAAILSLITIVSGEKLSKNITLNNNESKDIQNPGYPEAYSGSNHCEWFIEVPKQNYLSASCEYQLPKDCQEDMLFFGDNNLEGFHACENSSFNALIFNTPGYLAFYSSKDSSGGKFKCTFDTAQPDDPDKCVCGWKPENKKAAIYIFERTDGKKIYPFLAAILYRKQVKGSATIISRWFAVTSASCLDDAGELANLELAVGGQDENYIVYHKLANSLKHADYDAYEVNNNIAIISTEDPIEFNDYVGVACLPYKYKNAQDNLPDTATVLGWTADSMKDNSVVATNITLMTKADCEKVLGQELGKGQQCTQKKEGSTGCKAQEGAPLIWQWNEGRQSYYFLYMFSWAQICDGIAMTTKIIDYLDWIDEKTEGEQLCKMEH